MFYLGQLRKIMTDYVKHINNEGGEVYIVGGAVRNFLYNNFHNSSIPIKDYDFLVRLLDQYSLTRILKQIGSVKEVGQSFGIVLFTTKKGENIEFALPRTEISTGSGYRDFIVTTDHNMSIEEDFSRRDATINSIAIKVGSLDDLKRFESKKLKLDLSQFIDPFNGVNDIKNKIWKCVGDPKKRFIEDPNRIMRAFRQSAELDLTIETNTLKAISEDYHMMKYLIPQSYVRLYNELFKMMKVNSTKMLENLNIMHNLGILDFLGIKCGNLQINLNEDLVIKFATLICLHTFEENIKMWANNKQISATNYLSPLDINTLVSIQKFWKDVVNIKSLYDLLKVTEQIYKLFKMQHYDIIKDILTYVHTTNLIGSEKFNEIQNYLLESKSYPVSTDQLVLNGNILMTKWNLKGTEIKNMKELLLDLIFKNVLTNNLDVLTDYVNDIQNIN